MFGTQVVKEMSNSICCDAAGQEKTLLVVAAAA
jgi:hypothetical protein